MKIQLNCGTCTIKQAISAMNAHEIEGQLKMDILEKLISDIPDYLNEPTPSHFQSIFLEKLSATLQIDDLNSNDKKRQNSLALELEPYARKRIDQSGDPLYTSALLAVEGNSIDQLFIGNYDLKAAIDDVFTHRFIVDDFASFVFMLGRSNRIAYLIDNAGEIVFDKVFIEYCQKWRSEHGLLPAQITAIVKGGPVLNDATEADAKLVGLDNVSKVISTGINYLGSPLDLINNDSKLAISAADMIIAKGQANFETIGDEDGLRGKTFFLLKTKCFHVSDHFRVSAGSCVLSFPA